MIKSLVDLMDEVTDEIIDEVLLRLRPQMESIVHGFVEDYLLSDEDASFKIRERIEEDIKNGVACHDKDELWLELYNLRKELKTGAPSEDIKRLSSKIDTIHQNMDALFAELKSLKSRM